MANLSTVDKQVLEKLFNMSTGYVLKFTDRTFAEFFRDDLKVEIYDKKYSYGSGSKANRLRAYWIIASDSNVANSILKLVEYIRTQIAIGDLNSEDYPMTRINACIQIAEKLMGKKIDNTTNQSNASFLNGNITITLQHEVFDHVKELLNNGHYFNAVEESYKIVRKKLKDVSGKEKATDAFNAANYERIFGHQPVDEAESDFFEGVKFLHMAIQFLRNEKAHTPAKKLNMNLAIHYISLASLAYDLISRK